MNGVLGLSSSTGSMLLRDVGAGVREHARRLAATLWGRCKGGESLHALD